jgi:hypothetical protein
MNLSSQIVYGHRFIQVNAAVGAVIHLSTTESNCHRHGNGLTKRRATFWAADELDRENRASEADNANDGENGHLVAVKTAEWAEDCNQHPATDADAHSPSHPASDVVANCHARGVYPNRFRPDWDALHSGAAG